MQTPLLILNPHANLELNKDDKLLVLGTLPIEEMQKKLAGKFKLTDTIQKIKNLEVKRGTDISNINSVLE